MKKSSSKPQGNKGKQINSLRNKPPQMHDDPMRHQPPTPQDIQRVQPVSQHQQKDHLGNSPDPKNKRTPKEGKR